MVFLIEYSNNSVPHCQTEKTNGRKLPHFWEWVQFAHYTGNITVRDVNYDHWVFHVSCMLILLNCIVLFHVSTLMLL